LGLNNFITCVSNVSKPFIIDGNEIEKINKRFNKRIDALKSKVKKSNKKNSTQLINKLFHKKQRTLTDHLHKISHEVTKFVEAGNICKVIIGYNQC
jgi:uncharacterized membrane protein (DUF106 family)